MSNKPHDTATTATAEEGEVMLDGPDGLAISLTPDAAAETARVIRVAADVAAEQRLARSAPREHEQSRRD